MTKAELVEAVAKDTGLSKAQSEKALNAVTGSISKLLKKGGKITLTGFGTFSVSKRKARKGHNPQTGEAINIKAKKVAKFKPGQTLKEMVA